MERLNRSSAKIWKHKVKWLPVGMGSWSCWRLMWCWEAQSPGLLMGHSHAVLHGCKQCWQLCSLAKGHLSSLLPHGLVCHLPRETAVWGGMHPTGWGHSATRRAQSHPEEGGVLQLSALQPGHLQGFLALARGQHHLLSVGRGDSPFVNFFPPKKCHFPLLQLCC